MTSKYYYLLINQKDLIMSESSNLKESFQSFVPTNYSSAIEIEQLNIPNQRSLLLSVKNIDSKLTEQSLPKNVTDVVKTNKTVSDRELLAKKRVRQEYPLTKWSKREMAAKIRTERNRKFENIKMTNDKITRGAEVIKVYII